MTEFVINSGEIRSSRHDMKDQGYQPGFGPAAGRAMKKKYLTS
jgi:hypothetical protein